MAPTGLPIPAAALAPAATPTAAATDGAGADFVEMLAQMILGSDDAAPQAPGPAVAADSKSKDEKEASDPASPDAQLSAQPGVLPFPLFNQIPPSLTPAPTSPSPSPSSSLSPSSSTSQPLKAEHAGAAQSSIESIVREVAAPVVQVLAELQSPRRETADSQQPQSASATPDAAQFAVLAAPKFEPPAPPPVVLQVHAAVGSQHWPDQLGAQLTMMAHRGEHVAALKLSPEHLGPLEVRITTQDDRTTVWFGATHAETRAALEQALPRLRELFAAQGMQLTDAGVHREPTRNNSRAFSASNREGTAGDDTGAVSATTAVRVGLLDAYA